MKLYTKIINLKSAQKHIEPYPNTIKAKLMLVLRRSKAQ